MDKAWAAVPGTVERLTALGVIVGSHDDADAETRARWRALGVAISEFPMSVGAAEEARQAGEPIILGGPNIVRGGSHKKGGMAVQTLLDAGLGDALASDYHYPSLLSAARRLLARGWPIERIWPLISSGPARVLGMTDRGQLEPGQRADVIVTDPTLSHVLAVFAEGRPVHIGGALAGRWLTG